MFKHFKVSAIYTSSLDVQVTSGAAKLTRELCIYWIFLGRLNPIVRNPVLPFFLKIKLTSVSRGLRGVFLSTIRNLAYKVLRVLSRGQNYRFRTVVTEEP